MSRLVSDSLLSLPLGQEMREKARKQSLLQPNAQKSHQVYLNILAVETVNNYLLCMGYQTRLNESDSLNYVVQYVADIADLEIEGIGKIECRAVKSDATEYEVPPEVWHDRVGYIFLEIDEEASEGVILGFVPNINLNGKKIKQQDLKPLEMFLEHLERHDSLLSTIVPFSEWLVEQVTTGWISLQNLLQEEPIFAYRNSSRQEKELTWGKLINVGLTIYKHPLVLLISLNPCTSSLLSISVRLQTINSYQYIPEGLNLSLVSEDTLISEIKARNQDNALELGEFKGTIGETFTVNMQLEDFSFSEEFII